MLFLWFFLALIGIVAAASNCPSGSTPSSSTPHQCHYFGIDRMPYLNAEQECLQLGGHLAMPKKYSEAIALSQEARALFNGTGAADFWFGANFINNKWEFIDGSQPHSAKWNKQHQINLPYPICGTLPIGDQDPSQDNCFNFKPYVCEFFLNEEETTTSSTESTPTSSSTESSSTSSSTESTPTSSSTESSSTSSSTESTSTSFSTESTSTSSSTEFTPTSSSTESTPTSSSTESTPMSSSTESSSTTSSTESTQTSSSTEPSSTSSSTESTSTSSSTETTAFTDLPPTTTSSATDQPTTPTPSTPEPTITSSCSGLAKNFQTGCSDECELTCGSALRKRIKRVCGSSPPLHASGRFSFKSFHARGDCSYEILEKMCCDQQCSDCDIQACDCPQF